MQALARVVQIMAEAVAETADDRLPHRLCEAFTAALGVRSAAISVMSDLDHRRLLHAQTSDAAGAEQLQFSLGEGPGLDAFLTGRPVLAGDLSGADARRWPLFAAGLAAQGLPVRAAFAFPMSVSEVRFGVLGLYQDTPGLLDEETLSAARIGVEIAGAALLKSIGSDESAEPGWLDSPDLDGVEIDQAVGMAMAQLDVDAQTALARLRARAFADGRPLGEVARDLIDRRFRFAPEDRDRTER
ncbi:GAF and ANTAR domain-containing protein [Streptacidiphilus monticola]|uniref:GAF and ANTAR domain-containing protein n=1 Tax=Streptacidiphilus monticola TaxID=2161674 RepID=A0ABW1G2L2_9ACTN